MRSILARTLLAGFAVSLLALSASAEQAVRRLPVSEYRDKMKAGWIGQIIGVSWGAPTEGKFDHIMPEDKMPPFQESLVNNAFGQDDLYVEMTFLRSMELYGLDVSIRQAGIDFANSEYKLWVANEAGRTNLRSGIAPPDSSHPKFHRCPGAIDYQIEADYSGLIAPGMPETVIGLGEKFGRLMNYGDGMYAGQFIGGMYAEAFFEKDVIRIIEAGLKCIPPQCQYAEMVRDMLRWYRENPDSWEKTWELISQKYRKNPQYHQPPLDAKVEGAYVLMGLLYGKGDLDQTMIISCRCGSDSDCNPSSSGGVLFTALGMSQLPDRYHKALDETQSFSYTAYNFPALLEVCEKITRQSVLKAGGRIEKDAAGQEVFVIPVKAPKPSAFESIHTPGPIADSRFTDEEMARVRHPSLQWAQPRVLSDWQFLNCNMGRSFLRQEWQGRKNTLVLFAPGKAEGDCTLARKLELASGSGQVLHLAASCLPEGRLWNLLVKVDGQERLTRAVTGEAWQEISVDLSDLAGKSVRLELVFQPAQPDRWKNTAFCISAPTLEKR